MPDSAVLARSPTQRPALAARVVVVGLGYVGLPIALAAAEAGFEVTGFDLDPRACHHALLACRDRSRSENLAVQTAEPLPAADVWLICVPTPLAAGRPDLRHVRAALGSIARHLEPDALVCLVSTCQPGATRDLCRPVLEARGLRVGQDVFLAVSPERENPGDASFGLHRTPRLVGALEDTSRERALEFWRRLGVPAVPVASAEIAECAKLLENSYRLVNIALMGELHAAFAALGVPTAEVVAAAATKPFGFAPFWPGLGAGGHCIPVDPEYLQAEASRAGAPSAVLAAAAAANRERPAVVTDRIRAAFGGALAGRRILVAGVTYKPGVADLRNAAALALIGLLRREGAALAWCDPVLAEDPPALADLPRLRDAAACAAWRPEALVLGAPHPAFDLARLRALAPIAFDPFGRLPAGRGVVPV